MQEKSHRVADLITRYLYGKLDEEGAADLESWKSESPENQELFDSLTSNELIESIKKSAALEKDIFSKIEHKIQTGEGRDQSGNGRIFTWRWLVAASIIFLVIIGSYLAFNSGASEMSQAVDTAKTSSDVAPGSYKAKLTLNDGSIVILDSAVGELAKQGHAVVKNEKGQLIYDVSADSKSFKEVHEVYNTLSTSIGEAYMMKLSDGSEIWLNSGSSVKFPVLFTASERIISVSGEVYLNVAKDSKRPFKVEVLQEGGKKCEVQVLGTSFNVMAYPDEQKIETTVLEGKIVFTNGSIKRSLIPGQQVTLDEQGVVKIWNEVKTDVITAWKNEDFYFKSNDLKAIMRHLARWYGIQVQYEGPITEELFSGQISRNKNLSEVLKLIQQSGIKFRVEGKKVTVYLK